MDGNPLGDILTRRLACPECGEENSSQSASCSSCGTSLQEDDEEGIISQLDDAGDDDEEAPQFRAYRKIPLDKAKNYLAIKKAEREMPEGTMTLDEYTIIVRKVRRIADSGVLLFASPLMDKKFAKASPGYNAARRDMAAAFQLLQDGMKRMGNYLESGDMSDVLEGAVVVEAAYVAIDRAQDRAEEYEKDEVTEVVEE